MKIRRPSLVLYAADAGACHSINTEGLEDEYTRVPVNLGAVGRAGIAGELRRYWPVDPLPQLGGEMMLIFPLKLLLIPPSAATEELKFW